ncbi:MAG: undecaprenyldiphospho-muramoylpentapeptide beta-N-acetylglucosaminyltransferase [Bacteroidetes bacterium]|nr:MAG: undecaprenyldiphospho-muramoylpentapeptide beta-N-acetylglucosaminyltransferase [Bacteroidota bacterium]
MRIIISGGGTGGHIYPAIAIANEIKILRPDAEILFVGAKGKMEMEKVPKAGYPIEGLWISGLQRKLSLSNLLLPLKLLASSWQARRILKRFKPDAVVGVGGYASATLLYWATRAKIPALIQEQNSFAGLTNRRLASQVQRVCVSYEGMEKFFPAEKILLTGNPVRQDIYNIAEKRAQALQHFGLSPDKKTLLVVGGSLGARSINESIARNLDKLVEAGLQILWQTGKNSFEHPESTLSYLQNPAVKKTEFIYEMDLGYAVADLVVSRAGALAVSELCLVQKPSIFVPYPFAAEDHQTKNAEALVGKQAGICIKDSEAREQLLPAILNLAKDGNLQKTLSENMKPFAKPQATRQIAEEVLKLVK